MNEIKYATRHSGIELLKCIAIVLIVMCHSVPYYGSDINESFVNLQQATRDMNNILLVIMKYCGSLGNCIFVVASFSFLVKDSALKMKKVLCLIIDSLVVSILIFAFLKLAKVDIGTKDSVLQFFPIISGRNWFVASYILIYIMHPALNLIIRTYNKQQLIMVTVGLILIYGVVSPILGGVLYYSDLVGFITVYFAVGTTNKYGCCKEIEAKKWSAIAIVSLLLILGEIIILNIGGLYFSALSTRVLAMNKFTNPLMVCAALSLFYLFKEFSFKSKIVNYLASLGLYIYMITENDLICKIMKPIIWERLYYDIGYNYVFLLAICFSGVSLIIGIILSSIYKVVFSKTVNSVSSRIENIVDIALKKYGGTYHE